MQVGRVDPESGSHHIQINERLSLLFNESECGAGKNRSESDFLSLGLSVVSARCVWPGG